MQQGLDIPENLDDLVLSEDEKEVSNKQDTAKSAEDVVTVETEAKPGSQALNRSSENREKSRFSYDRDGKTGE